MSGIPHNEICIDGDRSWTMRLLEALKDPGISEEERDEAVGALQVVDDPRCIEPLTNLLEDTSLAVKIREAAGAVLWWMGRLPDNDTLVRWWNLGDEILRHRAFWGFDYENSDIVVPIASDPDHPYHLDAIEAMRFDFEMPEHQELKIKALSHHNPRVRKAAAINLLWSEPVKAEGPLIEATHDSDTDVAVEACYALAWYPTRQALRHLKEIATTHPDEAVRDQAQLSFENVRDDLNSSLEHSDCKDYIRQWLEPVWDILEYQETGPSESLVFEDPESIPTLQEVIAIIDNPDTALEDLKSLFWDSNWKEFTKQDRANLTARFTNHSSYTVREYAASVLADWNDQAGLIRLVEDTDFIVRKNAIHYLGDTTLPSPKAAAVLWRLLEHDHRTTEALEAYVKHEKPEKAIPRLDAIANDVGETEQLRATAVSSLADLNATKEIKSLLRFLKDEPPVTWWLHIMLLTVAEQLEIAPPDLSHLRDVDNANLQDSLAPFIT